jgi:hypothetical protein
MRLCEAFIDEAGDDVAIKPMHEHKLVRHLAIPSFFEIKESGGAGLAIPSFFEIKESGGA